MHLVAKAHEDTPHYGDFGHPAAASNETTVPPTAPTPTYRAENGPESELHTQ